ncbi:MAG: hypothetical protein KIT80_18565 [Chitinophagaceae bacterium]|nr:hypothetical protein [Chitinophagaceae bacterium]MCW5928930.1 hypothetical protein [Chitinophagaceae bacterium]
MRFSISTCIVVVFFCVNNINAQVLTEGQPGLFNEEKFSKRIYLDSNYYIQTLVPLEVEYFTIEFSNIAFDKEKKLMNIKGKVCFHSNVPDCIGLEGVSIFLAKENKNKLIRQEPVGETAFRKENREEGVFNISFSVKRKKKLYFYFPLFFAQRFDVYKIKALMSRTGDSVY